MLLAGAPEGDSTTTAGPLQKREELRQARRHGYSLHGHRLRGLSML